MGFLGAMMIVELGHFALILALGVALVQATLPLWGAQRAHKALMAIAEPAALSQFVLILAAFGALTYAFVVSDFSVRLVVLNSHSFKPMLYKISGVWGNHEGSLLLWALILAFFGACAAWFGGNLPPRLRARVIAVQGAIGVAFLMFMLFTSNPFLRLDIPPLNGQDLNPLLQDPGLAFHPPFLYLGYVGLSMAFSFSVAALIEGRVDAAWARWVRPWTLLAWAFLTVGIALGSWWAYYELGWGGFWFWDPVENASLMPWLLATALLHSALVVEKRESLKAWTILLAILAFGFSLIGTFIVRSGVITSVHAFANDPERGVFILMILAVFMGGALLLFAWRAGVLEAKGVFSNISRESALLANNLLLSVSAFVVFIGTIWPLIAELLFDRKLSVGAPFFNAAVSPFIVLLALILPIGAMLPWKRAQLRRAITPLLPALVLAIAVGLLAYAVQSGRSALGPIGVMLGLWVVLGALIDLLTRCGRGALAARLGRLRRLPRSDWGKAIAHIGMGVTLFAVAAMTAWRQEDIRALRIGESYALGGYEITFRDIQDTRGANYLTTIAHMDLYKDGALIGTLNPEKRFYPAAQIPTSEVAIHYGLWRDLYLVIGDAQANGGYAVRSYLHPFANWLWGGALLMALGGVLSLSDRRYRIAAGTRSAAAPQKAALPRLET